MAVVLINLPIESNTGGRDIVEGSVVLMGVGDVHLGLGRGGGDFLALRIGPCACTRSVQSLERHRSAAVFYDCLLRIAMSVCYKRIVVYSNRRFGTTRLVGLRYYHPLEGVFATAKTRNLGVVCAIAFLSLVHNLVCVGARRYLPMSNARCNGLSIEDSGVVASVSLLTSIGSNRNVGNRNGSRSVITHALHSPSKGGGSSGAETFDLDNGIGLLVAFLQFYTCAGIPRPFCACNNASVQFHSVIGLESNLVAANIGAVGGRLDYSGVVLILDIHVCSLLAVGIRNSSLYRPSQPCFSVDGQVGDGDVGLRRACFVASLVASSPCSVGSAPRALANGGNLRIETDARCTLIDYLTILVTTNYSVAYGRVDDGDGLALSLAGLVLHVPGKAVLLLVAETLNDSIGLVGSLVAIGIHKGYAFGGRLPPRLGNASDILGGSKLEGVFALGLAIDTSGEAGVLVVIYSNRNIVGAVFAAEGRYALLVADGPDYVYRRTFFNASEVVLDACCIRLVGVIFEVALVGVFLLGPHALEVCVFGVVGSLEISGAVAVVADYGSRCSNLVVADGDGTLSRAVVLAFAFEVVGLGNLPCEDGFAVALNVGNGGLRVVLGCLSDGAAVNSPCADVALACCGGVHGKVVVADGDGAVVGIALHCERGLCAVDHNCLVLGNNGAAVVLNRPLELVSALLQACDGGCGAVGILNHLRNRLLGNV